MLLVFKDYLSLADNLERIQLLLVDIIHTQRLLEYG